jgi:hypothetical protein
MNKKFLFSFALLLFITSASADKKDHNEQVIEIKGKTPHSEWSIPADMPDVYYNSELGVVTIVDYANVTYNPISLIRVYGRTAFVLNRLPQWGRSENNNQTDKRIADAGGVADPTS